MRPRDGVIVSLSDNFLPVLASIPRRHRIFSFFRIPPFFILNDGPDTIRAFTYDKKNIDIIAYTR